MNNTNIQNTINQMEDEIRTFISFLYIHNPFYNSLINNFELDFISTDDSKKYQVYIENKFKIKVDIDFAIEVFRDNKKILFFYIIHEILHVIFQHSSRKKECYDSKKWDAATDLAIELTIKADKTLEKLIDIPPKEIVIVYEENNVVSAEEIYKKVKITENDSENKSPSECEKNKNNKKQLCNHGSWNKENDIDENAINEILVKADNASKLAGKKTPDTFNELIKNILKPTAKLLPFLNKLIQSYKKTSFTYKRGDRRYLYNNLIVPSSIKNIKHFELLFYVDTSLSMNIKDINKILSEIIHLLKTLNTFKLEIIYSDTSIKKKIVITEKDTINFNDILEVSGRGGTDLGELFEKDISNYDVVIIYSDFYISDFDFQGIKKLSINNTILNVYSEENINKKAVKELNHVLSL